MKKIVRLLVVIMCAVVALTATSCSGGVDALLEKTADALNAQCPMAVDSETQLDKVEIPVSGEIRYIYSLVNYAADELDPDQLAQLESTMKQQLPDKIKTSEDMKSLRDYGVVFEYRYNDKAGNTLFVVTVTPDDYK